jgi:hypothetical protein
VRAVTDNRVTKNREDRFNGAHGRGGARGRGESSNADRRFGARVARIYDEIIDEPLPTDLAALVAKLRLRSFEG